MRWITFVIAAYGLVCVQFALGALLGWRDATPNVVLPLVVFVALFAKPRVALAAAFVAGLMHDVIAGYGLGAFAVAYPLVVAIAFQLKDVMYADLAATHATMTLILAIAIAIYLELRHLLRLPFFPDDPPVAFWQLALGALATALVAIPLIGLFRKMRRTFGLTHGR